MKLNPKKLIDCYNDLSIKAAVGLATSKPAQAIALMGFVGSAHATTKLSTFTTGWQSELSAGLKFFLLAVAAIGICLATVSSISWVIAKKNQEPTKWQHWGLLGGAAAVIMPIIVLAAAGSLGNGSGNAATTFNNLGITP